MCVVWKLVQFLLVGVCIGLHYYSYEAFDEMKLYVITGTYGLFAVILLGDLAASCASKIIPIQLELFYYLCGVVMFGTCGFLNVTYFNNDFVIFVNWLSQDNQDIIKIGLIKSYASFGVAATYVMSIIGSIAYVKKHTPQINYRPANSKMFV